MTWKCEVCGTENADEDDYCIVCGSAKKVESIVEDLKEQPSEAQKEPSMEQQPQQAQPVEKQEEPKQEVSVEQPIESPPQGAGEAEEIKPQVVEEQPKEAEKPEEKEPAMEAPDILEQARPITGTPYFLVVNSPDQRLVKTKIPLEFDTFPDISIGRSPENVVILPDADVSKRHAMLHYKNSTVELEDLNSTNGTYVYENGAFRQITSPVGLKSNMLIRFGYSTLLKFMVE